MDSGSLPVSNHLHLLCSRACWIYGFRAPAVNAGRGLGGEGEEFFLDQNGFTSWCPAGVWKLWRRDAGKIPVRAKWASTGGSKYAHYVSFLYYSEKKSPFYLFIHALMISVESLSRRIARAGLNA